MKRGRSTLDEAYSRNLSRYVRAGFAEKFACGHAIGKPPLGYRTERSPSGRGAWAVPDDRTMPALLALLRGYASGEHSFQSLARSLNAQGYRTGDGRPFTESSITTVLNNRFYEGKVVYHRGKPDEEIVEGAHQVPRPAIVRAPGRAGPVTPSAPASSARKGRRVSGARFLLMCFDEPSA